MKPNAEILLDVILESMKRKGLPTDRRPDPVPFEVFGYRLYLRPMTAVTMAQLHKYYHADPRNPDLVNVAVFALSVCGADGEQLFTLDNVHELANSVDPRAINAVAIRTAELNKV